MTWTRYIDLTGQQFGRLAVIEFAGKSVDSRARWLCKCECGNETVVMATNLKKAKSCGHCKSGQKPGIRLPEGVALRGNILVRYKDHAVERGYAWDLSDKEFFTLIDSNCFYCDAPPRIHPARGYTGKCIYNGVDRMDNSKGYAAGNVVACCSVCNVAKGQMSSDEFLAWVRRVYRHTESDI